MNIYSTLQLLDSFPNNVHYLNRYKRFILHCQKRDLGRIDLTEHHHILPKSMFRKYSNLKKNKWNSITLSNREHFIAHWLLWKAFNNKPMTEAFMFMSHLHQDNVKINSKTYSILREQYRKINPFNTRIDGTSIQQDRVREGTHHLLRRKDGTSIASDLVKLGIHPLQKRQDGTSRTFDRIAEGTNKFVGNVVCVDFKGNVVVISKYQYQSQEGNMENWEYVQNLSQEGQRRRIANDPSYIQIKSKKNTVPCYDKSGEFKRISKDEYFSQNGPKENWDLVNVGSKEAKKRKKC